MSLDNDRADFDIIVVGAGLTGIIAAQRMLQAHPDIRISILERDDCVGGVWNKQRVYPSFWSQWTHGIAEFSDMPMERPPEQDCMHDLFRAKYTTKYLEEYVSIMKHRGQTLGDRIQFNTQVECIKKIDERWQLTCIDVVTKSQRAISSRRLMMANGQCSIPNVPDFAGREHYKGQIIHSMDFGKSDVMQDNAVQHITVLGAGKSAADMVYEGIKAGKTVSWIIRKTGDGSLGAAAFAPIDLPTPYKNGVEASQARIMASLQPSYLIPDKSWWSWLLHSTKPGARLVSMLFSAMDQTIRTYAGYRERQSDKGFEKLEYDNELIWINSTAGGCHFADFWPLVAERVYVHRADVKLISGKELYLDDENGTHFPCDAILCGTGWKDKVGLFDDDTRMRLGLPYPKSSEPQEERAKWEKLLGDADEKILKRFVMLRTPPKHYLKQATCTPHRLYQTMAPVSDDSILFMNYITAGAKLFVAEAQAIWAVAYWDKAFQLPSVEQRENDIAHMIAWNKRRYLSNGELGTFAAFDSVPYVDRLFDEIGVTAHRKKGWLGNMFAPIMPADLGRVWREYVGRQSGHQLSTDFSLST